MCLGNDGGREWLSGVEVGVPGPEIDGDFDDSRCLDSSWSTPKPHPTGFLTLTAGLVVSLSFI